MPKEPEIKVISEKEENKDYYISEVKIKIEGKEGEKTTYKITGDKEQKETEIKAGETITIKGVGEYIITAYSYGKEGNKSKGTNKVIKIKGKHTITYNPGTEGVFSEQKIEEVKYGEATPKFSGEIVGKKGYMFIGWEPEIEETVTGDQKYTAKWEKIEYTITYNPNGGKYTIPSSGEAKIETKIEETDTEEKGTNKLEYIWSSDNKKEPEKGWKEITNGSKIEKTGIAQPGTWYLWVKVTNSKGEKVETAKSEAFVITSNEDPANQITLEPSETEWTNKDIKITIKKGENLIGETKITSDGEEGKDYEIDKEGNVIVKTNKTTITVTTSDKAGNKIEKTIEINNIDKIIPTVELGPNGGIYVMPSKGEAKISTQIIAKDPEETEENGQSQLSTLEYAWSTSNTVEPEEWTNFTNGEKIEKTDIQEPGTWYLWTKVTDKAGNRAENIKTSEAYIVGSNQDPANKITLTADKTEWTNKNITITVSYGENLSQNRTLTSTGEEGKDYEINQEENKVTIKTNGKTVTATAEDKEGNKVEETLEINNIDKIIPTVEITPNIGNYTMPSEGNAKLNAVVTAKDEGGSTLKTLEYAWSQSNTSIPTEGWESFTNGEKVEKTEITEPGTWYLWVKVIDGAKNKATTVKTNALTITDNTDPANQITLKPSKTEWTKEDVKITIGKGKNLTGETKITSDGEEGKDYEIDDEGNVIVKTNGITITVTIPDGAGNEIVKTITINNIDKVLPIVELSPNGGNFVMPSEGQARINTRITAIDPEATSVSGKSELDTLEYAWSSSNTIEPTNWTNFTNGSNIEKTDINAPGTWYLWTKVTDKAGNRAEEIKVSKAFIVGSNQDPANKITLTADKTEWTNKDVTVTVSYGANLPQNKTLTCEGTANTDYTVNGTTNVVVKTNGKTITATAEDAAGNKVVTTLNITNIDKILPTVELGPNGGSNYTMPSKGQAKISTSITATDAEATEANGRSGLETLQYAWSQSNTVEPATWETFTNGNKVEKTGITEAGTWYLWTKVIDKAGNRSESIKVSNPFAIGSNAEEANKIKLTADKTTWTNEDVTVTVVYGTNLTQNKKLTCEGTANTDYTVNGTTNVVVKTNGKTVTAEAEDIAGNKVVTTLSIANIDKVLPIVELSPNGGNFVMPSEGEAKISTIATATDPVATEANGCSGLATLQYAWSQSRQVEPTEWTNFTNGNKVEKAGITQLGTWYLWTKVTDTAGNRAEEIKVSEAFIVGSNQDLENKITLTADKTEWTNKDITITATYGENLSQNRTLTSTGIEGTDYTINQEENKVVIKTNGKTVTATAEDAAGNVISTTLTIANIDKVLPIVELEPNGRTNYVMPSEGEAKISTIATATDPEATSTNGKSGLITLQYAWSQSKETEPTAWTDFTNGSKIQKTDINAPGTWYLWTKVIDKAGNRSENIKVSNAFAIGSNTEEANKITLTPDITEWTNGNVIVIASYGENLSQNRTLKCDGTKETDYTINGIENVEIKTNGRLVTATAEDIEGNKVVTTLNIANIDKIEPTVQMTPDRGTYTMPTNGTAKLNTIITVQDTGGSEIGSLEYSWSQSGTTIPSVGWKEFENGGKAEITGITEPGTWYLWVKVKDNAENYAKTLKTNELTITPNTDPANQITLEANPSAETWTNGDVTVTASYGANLIGSKRLECTGTAGTDYTINSETQAIVKTNNKTVTAIAEDGAGNQIVKEIEIPNIDKTAPTITSVTGNPTTWTNGDVTLTVNGATDSASGLNVAAYSFDGGTTWQSSNTKTYSQNTNNIVIKVRDALGNTYTHTAISITKIDKTAPTITSVTGNPTTWTNGDVTLTVNGATDSASGLNTAAYSFDGGTTWQSSNTKTYSQNTNNIVIKVRDALGNTYTHTAISITKIDKTAPTITSVTGNPTSWTNGDVTLTVNGATDSASGLNTKAYSFDGGTTWQSENTKTYSQNTNDIVIKVRDALGNIYTHTTINITKIDKTAPTMGDLTATTTSWTKNNVTLEGKATDSQSGIVAYQFSQDSNLTAASSNWKGITTTTSQVSKQEEVSTTGTWYFYVKDAIGNVNKKSIEIKIDKKNPTVSASNGVAGNSISVTLSDSTSATSGASGVTGWQYSTSSSTPTTWRATTTTSFTPTTAGTYYIFAKDAVNNVASTEIKISEAYWKNTNTGINYSSTKSAFENAKTGETVQLLQNCEATSQPIVPSGRSIIANTNGYLLNVTAAPIEINSNSTLTLTGTGTITSSKSNTSTIKNNGTLIVNSGVVKSTGYVAIENLGKVTVTGGTINSTADNAIWNKNSTHTTTSDPAVKITGGTVTSSASGSPAAISNWGNGMIYITGGTVSKTAGSGYVIYLKEGYSGSVYVTSGGTLSSNTYGTNASGCIRQISGNTGTVYPQSYL